MKVGFFVALVAVALAGAGCSAAPPAATTGAAGAPAAGAAADQAVEIRAPEFLLGAGDRLEIVVFRHDELKRSTAVDLSGKIMFPLIGDVQAAGKSVFALRDELAQRLSRYLVNPAVTVEVTDVLSRRVMVLGEVKSPGYFVLETEVSALDALARAGGVATDGNLRKVLLLRRAGQGRTETRLDLKKALAGEDFAANVALQNGDILVVPPTRIADISRYATYLTNVLSPVVAVEGAIVLAPLARDALKGKSGSSGISVNTNK